MTFNLKNFKVKVQGKNCLVVGTLSGLKTIFLFILDWWYFALTLLKYWTCACWKNFSGLWPLTLIISRSDFKKNSFFNQFLPQITMHTREIAGFLAQLRAFSSAELMSPGVVRRVSVRPSVCPSVRLSVSPSVSLSVNKAQTVTNRATKP